MKANLDDLQAYIITGKDHLEEHQKKSMHVISKKNPEQHIELLLIGQCLRDRIIQDIQALLNNPDIDGTSSKEFSDEVSERLLSLETLKSTLVEQFNLHTKGI